jgi:hypothetical protein
VNPWSKLPGASDTIANFLTSSATGAVKHHKCKPVSCQACSGVDALPIELLGERLSPYRCEGRATKQLMPQCNVTRLLKTAQLLEVLLDTL